MGRTNIQISNTTNRGYRPGPEEIATNRKKMAALIARCSGGMVRPIVVPPGVLDLRECPSAVKTANKRPYRQRSPRRKRLFTDEQIRQLHREYMQPGQTQRDVATRHGVSDYLLSVRFRELGLETKATGRRGGGRKRP